MLVRHADRTLERLETDAGYRVKKYGPDVTRAFRKRMTTIRNVPDEQDFYNQKSLHYEKLKGDRSHERSMRLNDQFRLILQIVKEQDGRVAVIVSIEDYH
jgi:proteic killer suppression protein